MVSIPLLKLWDHQGRRKLTPLRMAPDQPALFRRAEDSFLPANSLALIQFFR